MDDSSPMNAFPVPSFPVEADCMAARAQSGAVQWTLAVARLAQGFMSAGLAQAALAQRVWMDAASDWHGLADTARTQDPVGHVLRNARIRCESSLGGMRRVNDDWLACSFECAETLIRSVRPPDLTDAPTPAECGRPEAAPRGKPRAVA